MPNEIVPQQEGGGDVAENAVDISTIPGEERAAILLLSLNEEDAAGIIRHLEPKQVQRVGSAMARAADLSQDKVGAVHRAFLEDIQKYTNIGMGSEDFMRNALVAALGEDKANNLVDQILLGTGSKGLDSLKWMDPRQVASIIINEHPQIQTIVLSYLEPDQSAEILSQFAERDRLDLMMRIANLEEVQPSALAELNEIMEKQFRGSSRCTSGQDWRPEGCGRDHELHGQQRRRYLDGSNPRSRRGHGDSDPRLDVRVRKPYRSGRPRYSEIAA